MNIIVHCECGKYLSCDQEHAGRQAHCTGCGRVFVMPGTKVRSSGPLNAQQLILLIVIAVVASVLINGGVFIVLSNLSIRRPIESVTSRDRADVIETKKPLKNHVQPPTENKKAEVALPVENQVLMPIKVEAFESVSESPVRNDRGFIITCITEKTITIDKVVYNGTYEAKIAMFVALGQLMRTSQHFFP